MIKLYLSFALLTVALFSNTLVPSITTITFTPGTPLSQVVDLLNQHNTWAEGDNFVLENGDGFFYLQNSMTVAEREQAVWLARRTLAHLDNIPVPDEVTTCIASKTCPVTIAKITLLNPPSTLLDAPSIAASEAHRDLHPFFYQNLPLGPQRVH